MEDEVKMNMDKLFITAGILGVSLLALMVILLTACLSAAFISMLVDKFKQWRNKP